MSDKLTRRARREYILERHKAGAIYREIGKELGISAQRVGELVRQHRTVTSILEDKIKEAQERYRPGDPDAPIEFLELTVRVYCSLKRAGVTNCADALVVYQSGENFTPAHPRLGRLRNYGNAARNELGRQLKFKGYIREQ